MSNLPQNLRGKNRKESERSSKSTGENVTKAVIRDAQNIPIQEWPMKTGDLLANKVTATKKASKGTSTVQLMLNDLVKYANAYAEATASKTLKRFRPESLTM